METLRTWGVPWRVPSSVSFGILCSDMALWALTSRTAKIKMTLNKGTLSNQPQLRCVTPNALLGSWEWQLIKDMMSPGTDFETHAYWKGYAEKHPRSVNVVTYLVGDGDLDAGHRKVKASAAKEFVTRKTHTILSGKGWWIYWDKIKCKEHLEILQELS